MQDDHDTAANQVPGAGLCNTCAWQRVVVSGRGSAFSMCRRAAVDARFRKYPPLPVVACVGYERRSPGGSAEPGSDDGSSPSVSSPSTSPSSTSPSSTIEDPRVVEEDDPAR